MSRWKDMKTVDFCFGYNIYNAVLIFDRSKESYKYAVVDIVQFRTNENFASVFTHMNNCDFRT